MRTIEHSKEQKKSVVRAYCNYCKAYTDHEVVNAYVNKEGTGTDSRCMKCGSSRLGTIQGFNANLM
jgi:transposase-like protein